MMSNVTITKKEKRKNCDQLIDMVDGDWFEYDGDLFLIITFIDTDCEVFNISKKEYIVLNKLMYVTKVNTVNIQWEEQ